MSTFFVTEEVETEQSTLFKVLFVSKAIKMCRIHMSHYI